MNKELIGAIANLSFYIEEDPYFNGTYKIESDFDRYCYNHCKDIETVLSELENSIPKQVIIDKIEELEKQETELTDEEGFWGSSEILYKLDILREILEKGEKNE